MAFSNTRPQRMIQNFHLVWLYANIDEVNNDSCRNCIKRSRQVINLITTFVDVDACVDFITDTTEKALLVVSEELQQNIVSIAQEIRQIISICIFGNKKSTKKLTKEFSKVTGFFTDMSLLSQQLKSIAQNFDHNAVPISLVKNTSGTFLKEGLDTIDKSFMYTQILKEILLTIDFQPTHLNEYVAYCREQLVGNDASLKNVELIAKEYHHHQPIWWYTNPCFLYSMINRALRTMEIDLIIKMGFFLKDLHNHILQLHSEQFGKRHLLNSFPVYRGQGFSEEGFDKIKQTEGGLLSFNNFLSTSRDQKVSQMFAQANADAPGMIGVLFEISNDSSTISTPFANVRDVSYFKGEQEILFAMHSVFRIGQIKPIDGNTRLWEVKLTYTNDNDSQLHALTEKIREETYPDEKGWYRLGNILIKLGQLDQAEQVFDIIVDQTTNEREKGNIYHMLGMIKNSQGNYEDAVQYYEQAIEINDKYFSSNHLHSTSSYTNLGLVYSNMGEYSKALSYYGKALEIRQKALPQNHPDLAHSYNNIGLVYDTMGEYLKALSYYEQALQIREETLPQNHPDLAISYNNMGVLCLRRGEYSRTLSYYEKAFEIKQKILPENHASLAISCNNIGGIYKIKAEYSKALSYYEKALTIYRQTLSENHPNIASSYINIGGIYKIKAEYSKALSYYEKALTIYRQTLYENHPNIANCYGNIGSVYSEMAEYAKALLYYEKALEIGQKALPENHPDTATSCNCIGLVYENMGEYAKALSYYEKALVIHRKTLPENHPSLAASYNNIGMVYCAMRDYSKTLLYLEKTLEIYKETLPENHPNLATCYNNIGWTYYNVGEYSKALSYFERCLTIRQSSLPASHPDITSVKQSIEMLKKKLQLV